jgi:hypothetical protein
LLGNGSGVRRCFAEKRQPSQFTEDSVDGFSLGGGGEVKIGGPWTLKLECRWTHVEGTSGSGSSSQRQFFDADELGIFRNVSSNGSADIDMDVQTVRGAFTYHFWSGGNG